MKGFTLGQATAVNGITVVKRDGSVVPYDFDRIRLAIRRAYQETWPDVQDWVLSENVAESAKEVDGRILNHLVSSDFGTISVERIQDLVEQVLMGAGHYDVAKAYILYRAEHAKARDERPIPPEVKAAFDADDRYFPTPLQKFQFYDKYSRFNPDLGRRETWFETVDRTVAFLRELSDGKLGEPAFEMIREAILKMDVMPSMRLLAMAGPAARRNSMALYNCLKRDTQFVTDHGVRSFEDFSDGDAVRVLSHTGAWRNAVVRNYGRGMLRPITFKRTSNSQVVWATDNHRWVLKDGSVTDDLKVNDGVALPSFPIAEWKYEDASPQERLYWAYGFVYGDGTLVKSSKGEYGHSMVRLCGQKVRFRERFEELGFKTSTTDSLQGDFMAYTGTYLKTLPSIEQDGVDMVRAFVVGYLDADGHHKNNGSASRNPYDGIQASGDEAIKFIRKVFPSVGAYIVGERDLTGEETNYGERGQTVNFSLTTGAGDGPNSYFYARGIDTSNDIEDELWCLEVEVDRSFTLSNGIVTGNCSYQPVDSLDAFPEALLISMAGCGVGFSVERRCVEQLPVVAPQLKYAMLHDVYMVEDSAEGWADALRYGLQMWFEGRDVAFDYSLVRPAGAVLKTKGGRASGPGPLKAMLDGVRDRILSRQGQKLRPIDAHDIMCMVGQAAVSGGVRRTAMISLFDEGDQEMLAAKAPGFDALHPYRWNANNSAVRTAATMDDQMEFATRFLEMVEAGNGEPGIFSREVANALKPDRREERDFGTNPCVTGDTWVLTDEGPRQVRELVGKFHRTAVHGKVFEATAEGFWSTGVKPVVKVTTAGGQEIRLTANHQVEVVTYRSDKVERSEWKEASSLTPGDQIKLHNHRNFYWGEQGDGFDRGYVLGALVGDGTFAIREGKEGQGLTTAYLDFWGADAHEQMTRIVPMVHAAAGGRADLKGYQMGDGERYRIQSNGLAKLAERYGIGPKAKGVTPEIERESSEFYAGFLQGLFDADGCVQGSQEKGVSVRLAQSNLEALRGAQRMMLRMGINSTIYQNRREAGSRILPDGRGGSAECDIKAQHELVISKENIREFSVRVGFSDPSKRRRLAEVLEGYRRTPNRENFSSVVVSVEPDGEDEVFDCSVPGPNCFDANGFVSHNCGEIALRPFQFCNLTAAVVRADDTEDTLLQKVLVATLIGTIQSMATTFPGMRPIWRQNCEEERLLGVDITGQQDNPSLLTPSLMEQLRLCAVMANRGIAAHLGINLSAAITCVKPSGNTSQLVNCASGLHARWAPYYIRNVRVSASSPIAQVLKDAGVPMAPENGDDPVDPRTWVASFPVAAPAGAVTRNDRSAVEQCEWWLRNKTYWTEHNPSVTITYKTDEVIDLMKWVWDHREKIGGMAFLPSFDAQYDQLPYIEITKEEYERRVAAFPEIDFSKIYRYETDDRSKASTTIACEADICVFSAD